MVKKMTKQDVKGMTLRELSKFKGVSVLEDVISEAVRKGKRIICIGKECTGKSPTMKALIQYDEDHLATMYDGVRAVSELQYVLSSDGKYIVVQVDTLDKLIEMVKNATCKSVIPNIVVITCNIMEDNITKYIESIDEIIIDSETSDNKVVNIVNLHKKKYTKVDEIS